MSVFRRRTEAKRLQSQRDHEFFWGVVNKDEKALSQLPPGPAAPTTFLHFLQQGDLSDEALAAFNPEALQILQSLRRDMNEKRRFDLSEWHAEWAQSEQQPKQWVAPSGPSASQSLLTQPANIELFTHDLTAPRVLLDYWGEYDEAPAGAQAQRERWAKEAEEGKHRGNRKLNAAPISALLNRYAENRDDALERLEDEVRGQDESAYHNQQCGCGSGY
ncbi:hypothetical protein P171DRAFT_439533 [Karstenula rhodostoma CBS 690.94]|uniref:Uncharacterized protein n=1 Tax=Karstenula rhodostoma CBS 690.94 TaxID=1392251 RepID=A0A9P4PVE2_9PLEO|nr:hypothetical protein P171DRAFT_439533 [Karstenula rhodostoma CBS 690.94]